MVKAKKKNREKTREEPREMKSSSTNSAKERRRAMRRRALGSRNPFQDTGEVREYELLVGIHNDVDSETGEKVVYDAREGDTVKSSKPLDKMFPNKFRLLGGKARRPHDRDDHLDRSGRVMDRPLGTEDDEDDEDDVRVKRRKANRQEGVVRKKKTSPADRDFEDEYDEDGIDVMMGRKKKKRQAEDESDEGSEEAAEESKFGSDVTGDFEEAASADLKVFHNAKKGYTVVDGDQPDKALPRGKELKSSKQVNKFLADYKK